MKLFLNAADLCGGELAQAIKALGWDGVRIGGTTDATAATLEQVQGLRDAGLECLCIVGRSQHLEPLAGTGVDIEVWNEPDIGTNGQLSVDAYRRLAIEVALVADGLGGFGRVWVGAVSNLNDRGLSYLEQLFAGWAPSAYVGCSFHRYPHGGYRESPTRPHDGFPDRAAEVERLRSVAKGRALAMTEGGYHTAPRRAQVRDGIVAYLTGASRRWTDAEVLEHLAVERRFWEGQGVELCTIYQINDGPNRDEALHTYGIRRHGEPFAWKPSAELPRL